MIYLVLVLVGIFSVYIHYNYYRLLVKFRYKINSTWLAEDCKLYMITYFNEEKETITISLITNSLSWPNNKHIKVKDSHKNLIERMTYNQYKELYPEEFL